MARRQCSLAIERVARRAARVHPAGMTQAASPQAIRVVAAADGTLTYLVGLPPDALPPVRARDIDAAWHHARAAATREAWGVTRLFRFRRSDGGVTDLALADPDAACWAAAVDAMVGIGTAYGLSVCLRLLALVDLMAHARWAGGFFTLRRDGADISPALLSAAATARLTAAAQFDIDDLRGRLPRGNLLGVSA
jgi:hypothetical protein